MYKKFFVCFFILISASASPLKAATASNVNIACAATVNSQSSFFKQLNIHLDSRGMVSGTYLGAESENATTPIDLLGTDTWMHIENPPYATLEDGNIKIVLDFVGKMGSDEDIYTLTINPSTGATTVNNQYYTDCGDGIWRNAVAQQLSCVITPN